MQTDGYTKLHASLLTSTVWLEADHVRIVWVTLLALSNKEGIVQGSVPGLANVARVPVDKCREAIERLLSPDPDSRSGAEDGRRIETIQGGWRLINFEHYRRLHSEEERKEYKRRWMAEKRALSTPVHKSPQSPPVDNVDTNRSKKQNTESEWLASLASDPANAGVDVAREADKCRFWCNNNRRQFTRKTFVNWLLRADREIKAHGNNPPDQRPNSRRFERTQDYSGVKNHGLGA
jgi:hypothetical protein